MSDDIREVKVTGNDIEGVRNQLAQLHSSLPEGQQHVLEWLMQRASEAPANEEVSGYNFQFPQQGLSFNAGPSAFSSQHLSFYSSLGVSQLGHLGRIADAGSSVGVTGSVMF